MSRRRGLGMKIQQGGTGLPMRMCILACEIPCSNPRGVGVVVRIVGHGCDVKLRGPPYSEAQVTYIFTDYWFIGGYLVHTEWQGQYLALSAPARSGNFHPVRPSLDKFGDGSEGSLDETIPGDPQLVAP